MGLWAQTPEIEARWVGSKDLGLDLSRRGAEGRRDEVGLGRLTEVQDEAIKGNV